MPSKEQVAAWRTHPNANGPAAMLLAIHDQFRAAANRLLELREVRSIARVFIPLANTLHHHHHAEEEMLFPLVERRTGVAPSRLQSDHDDMTAAIGDVEDTLAAGGEPLVAAVIRFHDILMPHLDREEELVVPLLLELRHSDLWPE